MQRKNAGSTAVIGSRLNRKYGSWSIFSITRKSVSTFRIDLKIYWS